MDRHQEHYVMPSKRRQINLESYILHDSVFKKKLEQAKPIYNDRTLISGYLGLESRQGLTGKGQERTFWGDGIVLCLGCDDGYTGACMSQNSPNHAFKIISLCVNYTSIKFINWCDG